MSITKRLGQTIIMLLASFTITSCSTYPSKFKCGDARGLGCTCFMRLISKLIRDKSRKLIKIKIKIKNAAVKLVLLKELPRFSKQNNKIERLTTKMS